MTDSAAVQARIPVLRKLVDGGYQRAYRLLDSMRNIGFYAIDSRRLMTLSYYVTDDLADESQQMEASRHRLQLTHEKQGDDLGELLTRLAVDHCDYRLSYLPICPLCQYSYPILGNYQCGDRDERFAFPVIEILAWEVLAWGRACLSMYDVTLATIGRMSLDERNACDRLKAEFPLSNELYCLLRDRLYREQAQILRDLGGYATTLSSDDFCKLAHPETSTEAAAEASLIDHSFSVRELELSAPPLDTKSGDWILARKENREKLDGLSVASLKQYRLESKGGVKTANNMLGMDRYGRIWRRIGTENSHIYYLKKTLLSQSQNRKPKA